MSESAYDERTALLVVDVQNDFADPKGSLYVPGGEAVVPVLNAEIERALAAGARIIYTRDWHPPATPHFKKDGGIWPVHCVRDTWGAALHPSLRVEGPVVSKGDAGEDGYSGFCARDPRSGVIRPTALGGLLAGDGITRLVVGGLATDYCVRATVLDALERHYPVRVLRAAVRAVDLKPGDGARALDEMAQAGAVLA
ncbi:MAG: isochorismatase family protein [Candidatus Macondimonas sp.]